MLESGSTTESWLTQRKPRRPPRKGRSSFFADWSRVVNVNRDQAANAQAKGEKSATWQQLAVFAVCHNAQLTVSVVSPSSIWREPRRMDPSKTIAARPGKGHRLLRGVKVRYGVVEQFTPNKCLIEVQGSKLVLEIVNLRGRLSADVLITEDPRDKAFEGPTLRVFVYADIPGKSWGKKWAYVFEVVTGVNGAPAKAQPAAPAAVQAKAPETISAHLAAILDGCRTPLWVT